MTPLAQERTELTLNGSEAGLSDITSDVNGWLARICARDGLLTVFLRHSSASLAIRETSESIGLRRQIETASGWSKDDRDSPTPGPTLDKPAAVSLSIPVFDGATALGTGQSIFVIERRLRNTQRGVALHFVGSCR
jgi:secondary thiamine-phosphate synthase enzyme